MRTLHTPSMPPLVLALALALGSLHSVAQTRASATNDPPPSHALDIPAQPAAQALKRLVDQTGIQLVYAPPLLRGITTRAVNGEFTPLEALRQMLEGSGLQAVQTGSNAWTLSHAPASPASPNSSTEVDKTRLDSVFVSANRRNEPVREVPMQVNVLDAEQLGRQGARHLQDYLANQPGVDVNSAGGPGFGAISIRGVTTGEQTIATVGLYVDDVAFGSSGPFANGQLMALDLGLLDIKQVELLRGPQGTLYGAGAMGGLLKYVTHEPDTAEWSGKLTLGSSATRGGGLSHNAGVVINVPLKEDVAGLRLSAFNEHAGGSVEAIGPLVWRRHSDRGDTRGLRASLLLTPTNHLKLRLTGTTQTIRREGADSVDYRPEDSQPLHGERQRRLYEAEPYRVRTDLVSADLEYDFGAARLNAITSRQRVRANSVADVSDAYLPSLAQQGLLFRSVAASGSNSLDKTTQELRLTSASDKQLEWLLGFYWDDEKSTNDQFTAATPPEGPPSQVLSSAALPARYREAALYGDVTWKFANGLALTGGLRVARNRQSFTQNYDNRLDNDTQWREGASRETSRTWLLTARYALGPGSSVYLRGASGYRPGGPNPVVIDPVSGAPSGPSSFQHDTLTNLEAGYKAELLNQRLSLEAAVFDIRWKNLQQYKVANAVSIITNAGAAHMRGAELAATWRPDEHWSLNGNAALIDAKLSEDATGLDARAGTRLPSSARVSASLTATYAFSLGGYASYAGLTQRYVGERLSALATGALPSPYRLPAYAMTDLQAGIDFKSAHLALHVRNLFNRAAQLSARDPLVPGNPALVSLEAARTVGATLALPF